MLYSVKMPSFSSGAASILDIGGVFDDEATNVMGEEADAIAMYNDWAAVGGDLRNAMNIVIRNGKTKKS